MRFSKNIAKFISMANIKSRIHDFIISQVYYVSIVLKVDVLNAEKIHIYSFTAYNTLGNEIR